MGPRYLAIFSIALAVILLEISYTRILSFKVYYYFTYLIIGLALLGLGAGGIFYSLSEKLRRMPLETLVPACSGVACLLAASGYPVIAGLSLAVSTLLDTPIELAKVGVVSLSIFLPFLAAGVSITALLASQPGGIGRMYAADLLGAGLGCAVAVPLLIALTPPGTVIAGAVLLAAGVVPLALRSTARWLAPVVGLAGLVVALAPLATGGLTDPVTDPGKQLEDSREQGLVVYSEWSPVFRIDVSLFKRDEQPFHWIQHDGQLGSTLQRFDGDLGSLTRFDSDARSFPFAVAGPGARVLIIGSAGGHEILASLYFKADHVTGVELNPATLSLLTGRFADFTGRLNENERVTLVNAEGRSFLNRGTAQFDLIWLVAPDSYAAMNAASSGAFVLSESYLYTVEMIRESLEHLSPDGVLCAQFGELNYDDKPNRTARFLHTARRALSERGVEDFDRHVLLATTRDFGTVSTVLLSPSPFSRDRIQRFVDQGPNVLGSVVRHTPGRAEQSSPVDRVIQLPQPALEGWLAGHRYDLAPVTDDAPFFWHFVRFRDAFATEVSTFILVDWEDAVGERMLIVLLGLVVVLAAIFLILPLTLVRGVWREIPHKANAAIYFSALGIGFMLLEVCLIQMLTLFLGYPTYSLSVTLFGLLIFSGVGSALSSRYLGRRNRALWILLGVLAFMIGFFQVGLPAVIDTFVGSALWLRVALAVAMIAPLGLCLGAFVPLGLETVSALTRHSREYLSWAWAINGFFSVITSILSTILAMTFGFSAVLLLGLAVYAAGVLAMTRIPAPERGSAA